MNRRKREAPRKKDKGRREALVNNSDIMLIIE